MTPASARKRKRSSRPPTAFLRNGYLGTTMDEIAAVAAVSKQTVYKHFEIKQRLFFEIVITAVDEVSDPNYAEVLGLKDTGDLAADLTDLARRQLARVMQPRLLQLRRLVIAEAGRFPDWAKSSTSAVRDGRSRRWLPRSRARGARSAATGRPVAGGAHFNWLIMSIPLNEAMLLGRDSAAPAALDRYAHAGVKVFLDAYGIGPRR